MAKFHFRLQRILDLRIQQRKQRRSELAKAQDALRILNEQFQQLAREFDENRQRARAAAGGGEANVDNLLNIQRYELVLLAKQAHLRQQQMAIDQQVARSRQSLVEADREVRTLEKLRDKQYQDYLQRERIAEGAALDEIAHWKRYNSRFTK